MACTRISVIQHSIATLAVLTCIAFFFISKASAGPACLVSAPADWQGVTVRWEGTCTNGQAEGSGVLRGFENGKVLRLFFGRMKAGQPEIGVDELPDGYVAGRFKDGQVVTSDDRNDTILAFREASKAAAVVSERFRAAGNAPSAKFYRDKAHSLGAQMD